MYSTKTALVKEIHKISGYTYEQIEKVYKDILNKHPTRNKYYARLAWIKRLQAMYLNLKNKKYGI